MEVATKAQLASSDCVTHQFFHAPVLHVPWQSVCLSEIPVELTVIGASFFGFVTNWVPGKVTPFSGKSGETIEFGPARKELEKGVLGFTSEWLMGKTTVIGCEGYIGVATIHLYLHNPNGDPYVKALIVKRARVPTALVVARESVVTAPSGSWVTIPDEDLKKDPSTGYDLYISKEVKRATDPLNGSSVFATPALEALKKSKPLHTKLPPLDE